MDKAMRVYSPNTCEVVQQHAGHSDAVRCIIHGVLWLRLRLRSGCVRRIIHEVQHGVQHLSALQLRVVLRPARVALPYIF